MFQSSSISSSKSRRFLLGFLIGVLLLLLPGILLSFYLQPLSGDLTRIGHLSERDFGSQHAQKDLTRLANDTPLSAADILILGDSFSDSNAWQSVLAQRTGLTTLTFHYDDTPCLDYWLTQAIAGEISSKARIIIIESVERSFIPRFADGTDHCQAAPLKPRPVTAGIMSGERSRLQLFPMNILHQLQTFANHLQMQDAHGKSLYKRTAVVDLTRSDLFSNRHPARLLYYSDDDEYKQQFWTPERAKTALDNLQRYQRMAAARGIRLLVTIIPDKSSVYAPWIATGQIQEIAGYNLFPLISARLGQDADTLTPFRKKAEDTIDFYAPNNTHLSLDGYRFLGTLIALRLQEE